MIMIMTINGNGNVQDLRRFETSIENHDDNRCQKG
jgi:hypothetical protein